MNVKYFHTFLRAAYILLLLAFIVSISVPIYMRSSIQGFLFTSLDTVPSAEVALILGASVVHGVPSKILEQRADTAIALYQKGKVKKILISGDNIKPDYNEITPVYKYLIAAGIAKSDIILDPLGLDTYSSMYRAHAVFHIDSVIIVTQDFHLPRSVYIARALGMNAIGEVARGEVQSFYVYIREVPASDKALFDLVRYRIPREIRL